MVTLTNEAASSSGLMMVDDGSKIQLLYQAAQQALSGQSNNVSATLANGSTLSSAEDARRRQHQQDQTTAAATARQNHQQQHSYDCDSTSSTMTTMANTTTVAPNSDLFLLGAAFQQQSQIQHQLLHQQSSYLQQQQLGDLMRGQLMALQERLQSNLVSQSQITQQLGQCKDKKIGDQAQLQMQQLSVEQQQLVQQIQMQQRHFLLQQALINSGGVSEQQKFWHDILVTGGSAGADPLTKAVNGNGNAANMNGGSTGVASGSSNSPCSSTATASSSRMWSGDGGDHSTPTSPISASSSSQQRLLAAAAAAAAIASAGGLLPELTLSHLAAAAAGGLLFPAAVPSHPLYQHGMCLWPSCEANCDNFTTFASHLNTTHTLDDRSMAQCRVQMQVVEQLDSQLSKEKHRLQAMMQHLQMKQHQLPDTTTTSANGHTFGTDLKESALISPNSALSPNENQRRTSSPTISVSVKKTAFTEVPAPTSFAVADSSMGAADITPPASSNESKNNFTAASSTTQPIRRRVSDKSMLPIGADIARNREFYRTHDVRPPYTYASLIRQAITESKDKQLTLNEIYNWFQDTFAFFRRNAATWKNAVRHNLSLHKCFNRVENVKGAVWTVDEVEFYKRRPQRAPNSTLVSRGRRSSPYGATPAGATVTGLSAIDVNFLKQENKVEFGGGNSTMDDGNENGNMSERGDDYVKEEEFCGDDEEGAYASSEREEAMDEQQDGCHSCSPTADGQTNSDKDVSSASDDGAYTKRNRFSTVSSADDEEPRNLTIDVERCNSDLAIKDEMAMVIENGQAVA